MTPAEIDIARRFAAAGAPQPMLTAEEIPAYTGGAQKARPCLLTHGGNRIFPGYRWFSPDNLLYEVTMEDGALCLLPLLSDPGWLGWTLCEVERRGYWWCLSARGAWSVTGPSQAGGDPCDRPAALVAMLEATR